MAAPSSIQDRRPAPGLNLSSNNPFRRAASPSALAPRSPGAIDHSIGITARRSPRPISTNPFLDSYKTDRPPETSQRQVSPPKLAAPFNEQREHRAAELIAGLSLQEQPDSIRHASNQAFPTQGATMPIRMHRPRGSREDDRRLRTNGSQELKYGEVNIFESPKKSSEHRRPVMRRNSESSMFDFRDEDRRSERRHRDYESRVREQRGRDGRSSGRPKKPHHRRLDVIDKLDVTAIYGPSSFHHDGPFDACNPERNRKGIKSAPMQAFPEGSANNALGGGGPPSKSIDYDKYHGRGAEGYSDFNDSIQLQARNEAPASIRRPERAPSSHLPPYHPPPRNNVPDTTFTAARHESFNPKSAVLPVHGETTAGLGTSTFLEGTPASRKDLVRRESESENGNGPVPNGVGGGGGLQRKRSIAQKLRGISRPHPSMHDGVRIQSPEARHAWVPQSEQVTSPGSPQYVSSAPQSAGGRGKTVEANPFFNEPSDKKAASVTVAPTAYEPHGRVRTGSSPSGRLVRIRTSEDTVDGEQKQNAGGGLLGRMKSFKGKKNRPERFASGG